MTTKETRKLSRIAKHSQEEFLVQGSLLHQTRLNRFILIAFLLHVSVIILQSLIFEKPKDPLAPPPIKLKYIGTQKTKAFNQKEPTIKKLEPIYAKKQKIKLPKQKNRQTKTGTLKSQEKSNITKQTQAQVKLKKIPAYSRESSNKNNSTLMALNKKTIIQNTTRKKTLPVPSERQNSQGLLSMLDRFDPEKYTTQETQSSTENNFDDDELISLNTTEAKYISYFNRIKHQIERAWRYPSQAAQRRLSGQLTLKFKISRDGNLLGVSLVDNSGFEILDRAAIKAVKEASPYYPFPVTIPKKKLSILATFIYNPNSNQSKTQ